MKLISRTTTQSHRNGAALQAGNRFLSILACACLLLGFIGPPAATPAAAAGILYVDKSSTCVTTCGGSWADAYTQLQDALAVAVNGDQIWVAAGVYYPDEGTGQSDNDVTSVFILINGVSVYGGFAGTEAQLDQRNLRLNPTILSGDLEQNDVNTDGNFIAETTADIVGSNALHVVQASNNDETAVLDGFVITGGYANGANPTVNSGIGGGVLALDGNPTLSQLVLIGNFATVNGGGLFAGGTVLGSPQSPSPKLSDLTVAGNQAQYGGGMFIDNSLSPELHRVTFNANIANYGGGLYQKNSTGDLFNVTFSANTANNDGGGLYSESSSLSMVNVTISGNAASGSGGGVYLFNSNGPIWNVLIANSLSGGDCAGSSLVGISYNLIEDSANACGLTDGVDNNIVGVDPKLGPLADNGGFSQTFALLPGSPAIDSGRPVACRLVDQRGVTRPRDGDGDGTAGCDIGAFEFTGTMQYVDADSTCTSACGGSWVDAYRTLQDALNFTTSNSQVWVAQGVYYPDEGDGQIKDDVRSIFTIRNGVAVYGGFAGTENSLDQRDPALHPTVLSGDLQQDDVNADGNFIAETTADIQGDNALHVVQASNNDETAVLDGFVITAGNANGANPTVNAGIGGGVLALNGNPILTNLILSGNNATSDGGGLYSGPPPSSVSPLAPAPVLSEITLTGNHATYGGGMFINNSTATRLENVTFQGNSSGFGGGLYVKLSDPVLTNLTFGANTADQDGGGIYNESSNPTLMNVTLSGNEATTNGGGIFNYKSTPVITNTIIANSPSGGDCVNDSESALGSSGYNLIEDSANACGSTAGSNGNITGTDPKLGPLADNGGFSQTFALLSGSPAIDAGTDASCPVSDQRGMARPYGSHCDIGAYELIGVMNYLPLVVR